MERTETLIIGGGASGLFLAVRLLRDAIILERGERVGKKLSATGNGQGNLSSLLVGAENYFSISGDKCKADRIIERFHPCETIDYLRFLGLEFCCDERGRIYPTSKQASAITDMFRYAIQQKEIPCLLGHKVIAVEKVKDGFEVIALLEEKQKKFFAKNVVFACGGKAQKNFGTDGMAYEIIKKLGHSITPLYPSLVQLKTPLEQVRGLKGIRTFVRANACVNNKQIASCEGDLIFADYGLTGDVVFRLSAFLMHRVQENVTISVDFLPMLTSAQVFDTLTRRKENGIFPPNEILSGLLPNALGRALLKRINSFRIDDIVKIIKHCDFSIVGSLGFDYAQVTKGGIPLSEVDDNLQSKLHKGLFFTGEVLDVDGECGGYNLTWAFASAMAVKEAIENES